jgi:hypothetical protein
VVTRAYAGQVCGHVAHRGTWVGTGRMDVSNRGSSWTGFDRRGRWSSKGVSVSHPSSGLKRIDRILISIRYTFFSGRSSKKNSRLSMLGLERFEDG